ncbi:unnamed protein product [Caenorhabditis nigoni]
MSQRLDTPPLGPKENVPTDEDLPEFEFIFKKIVENVLLAFESNSVIKPLFTAICRRTLRSEHRKIGAISENDVKNYEKKFLSSLREDFPLFANLPIKQQLIVLLNTKTILPQFFIDRFTGHVVGSKIVIWKNGRRCYIELGNQKIYFSQINKETIEKFFPSKELESEPAKNIHGEENFVRDQSYAMPQYKLPQIRAEAPESAKSVSSVDQSSQDLAGVESHSPTAQASTSREIPHHRLYKQLKSWAKASCPISLQEVGQNGSATQRPLENELLVKHPKTEQTFIFEHQEKQATSGVEKSIEPKSKRPKVEDQVESGHHETAGTDSDSLLEVKTEFLETDDHVESEPYGASGLRVNESSSDLPMEPTAMPSSSSLMLAKKVYPTCIRKGHLLETLQDVAQYANLTQLQKDVEKDLAKIGLEHVIDAEQVLMNLKLAIVNMGMFCEKGTEGSGLMKSSKAFMLMLHFAEQFDPLRHLTSDGEVEKVKMENVEKVIDVTEVEHQLNNLRRIFSYVKANSK